MLKDIKQLIKEVELSDIYKEWKKNNPKAFLANIFTMIEDSNNIKAEWQLHYYNPKNQKITSYTKHDKEILIKKDQDFVKQDEIKKLKISEIKEELGNLIKKLKVKYKNERITKIIVILQKSNVPIWNITLLTGSFNIIHVKVNAITGEFIKSEVKSAISFKL